MRSTTPKRGPQLSERVLQMKQNFMQLHQQGYSIPEIAEKFHVHNSTIYYHLQEIADENGTSRESLLQIIKTNSQPYFRQEERAFRLDAEGLMKDFDIAKDSISTLLKKIDNIIEDFEEEEK